MTELPHVFSPVLSHGLFGAVDVCLGLGILDQPDEVPVAFLVEEFCLSVVDVVLGRHIMDANLHSCTISRM